ncbi:hypothetical protein FOMPIDRAFT_1162436 [Fomitopsis schrenkii]|uniref:Class E vacuolar protein-sorting machinery protein HSE1 n=1 Tax=Fomitopsis schrenkii TaxID=2126942 RepID=S8ECQ3_FOMSC|nr:hypothetical protein FOMPIDRAFT_1162436 [Fomitopsis schrenkii]
MFRGGQANSYDEIVVKTTDENLTSENWELILNLCDKVQDEGEQGARNVVAAVLKRLAHRNPNVQLYTLTLAESLAKNSGLEVHKEIASRAFTQGLEKLVTDRTTHDKVRKRALSLIAEWTQEFAKDPTLGIMEECFESLKSKGYRFDTPDEPPPPDVDDEVRRREEEELQRVLEMSMHDKGGRPQWAEYSLASGGASGSGSSTSLPGTNTARQPSYSQPSHGGYVPSASPAVSAVNTSPPSTTTVSASTTPSIPSASAQESIPVVTRVRALHTFEPTEAGELAFEKGDIIKVVDRGYKDWWRGQLKGRTGIFPVNYVEPLPEPTAAELAREAEQEAAVFAQAANVDRLLTLLRGMDPAKDNLADNEEIQELYRNCMTLRPRIVKLIDKYSQKRADLVSMNETFVKARTIFDRMMEESLARNTSMYDPRPPYAQQPSYIARPDSRAPQEYAPQPYGYPPGGYDQGYNTYPAPQPGYAQGPERAYSPSARPQSSYDPAAYAQRPQTVYAQPQVYGAPTPYGGQPEPQIYPTAGQPGPQAHAQPQPRPQAQATPFQQATAPAQTQLALVPQAQPHLASQPQPQPQPQAQAQAQAQAQHQPQPQAQAQPQPEPQQQQSGPPYVYNPNTTYADPNVQAWAQYYAQGGTDPTGSVYFVSVPGIKEGPPASAQAPQPQQNLSRSSSLSTAQPGVAQHAQAQAPTTDFGSSAPTQEVGATHIAAEQHAQQPAPGSPTASVQPQPAYGGSPYGAAPAAYTAGTTPGVSPGEPQQGAWQAQYQGLPTQLAGIQVSGGENTQSPHPGLQGVGAPA